MNFFMMQSLGTYTKNMEMKMKWQQKKAKNDFTADGSTKLKDSTAQQAEEIRIARPTAHPNFLHRSGPNWQPARS